MKHNVAGEEVQEQAALYSLGALGQLEAGALERHIAEGCSVCKEEVRLFERAATSIGFAVPEQEPPLRVREKLVARLTREKEDFGSGRKRDASPRLVSVRAGDGEWKEILKGVFVKLLFVDDVTGIVTSLVRMQPGTRLPMHRHLGVEQFLVIEGDCHVHGEVLRPGDYHRADTGSIHEETFTVAGTLFLLVAPKNYEVLEPH